MRSHHRFARFGTAALTLTLVFLFAEAARAEVKRGSAGAVTRELKNAEKQVDAKIIEELKKIEAELKKVDHDYDGHRLKAMKELAAAIHELSAHKQGSTPPPAPKKDEKKKEGESTKEKEPQSASDAKVRQVIGQLQVVEKQLANFREHKGYAPIGKAIAELELGLKAVADKEKKTDGTTTEKKPAPKK